MSQPNNPEKSLPYHLRGAFRGFETALGRYLKRYDLPLSQFYILRLLWSDGGNIQYDIAKRAFMSQSVASQVVKKMEDRGLLRRKRDPNDSRILRVSLTATGEKLRTQIVSEGLQISTANAPKISHKDMKTTIEVLQKIREGFDLYNAS